MNHTHILDAFRGGSGAISTTVEAELQALTVIEVEYKEAQPDFIAACRLGRLAAKLWALKLKGDFPKARFRVYYTQYDNPIVRFHKVRLAEGLWLSDHDFRSAKGRGFDDALLYDTDYLDSPVDRSVPVGS